MVEWRTIPGFEKYEVSDTGLVRNPKRGGVLSLFIDRDGYAAVNLYDANMKRHFSRLARLVAIAFHGPPPTPKHQAAHWDGSKRNDVPSNLRWATCKENQHDRVRHGTDPAGARHPKAKLTDEAVADIRMAKSAYGYRGKYAAKYGVTKKLVDELRRPGSKIWPHVKVGNHA